METSDVTDRQPDVKSNRFQGSDVVAFNQLRDVADAVLCCPKIH